MIVAVPGAERERVLLFADLAGYTALTEAMGGAEAARPRSRFARPSTPSSFFPSVCAGIHGGRVYEHQGRYFGPAVNLAARVSAYARAGELLCTAPIVRAIDLPGIDCRPLGPVRFRNIADAVDVFEIVESAALTGGLRSTPSAACSSIPSRHRRRLPFAGVTYHFCSLE